MPHLKKKLIVVGDRLLVRPEEGEERTNAGLYLPQTAVAARQARGGWVVSVGPGTPIAKVDLDAEVWEEGGPTPYYVPMQAQEGDYVLFMHKAAVEITFEKKNYLIVPNSAVLVLVRDEWESERGEWEDGDSS
jgi:co-chaperonin GroES (HSP10)